MQKASILRHSTFSSVACLAVPCVSRHLMNDTIFEKNKEINKVIEPEMCFDFL
jgi:hypothetical protein